MPKVNTLETILERVEKVSTCGVLPSGSPGCWLWQGRISEKGYAWASFEAMTQPVHRIVYQLLKGEIPEGHDLHHRCEVKHCCNPDHLEPVLHPDHSSVSYQSSAQAAFRATKDTKTHCKHGHELTPENTRIDGRGYRCCRECGGERQTSYATRNPGKRKPYQDAYNQSYYQRNREKLLARSIERGADRKEEKREYDRLRRERLKTEKQAA